MTSKTKRVGGEVFTGLGDPDTSRAPTKAEVRKQREQDERAHTWTDYDRLTREEFEAGKLCRCGRPFFGGPEWVPILHRTPEQAEAQEAEDAAYAALHGDCHAGRWSVSGGGITHCMRCCPPPPLSAETITRVAALLSRIGNRPPHELMRWQLRLFCGHVIEVTYNVERKSWPEGEVMHCEECPEHTPRQAVLAARPLGLAGKRQPTPEERALKRDAKARAKVERQGWAPEAPGGLFLEPSAMSRLKLRRSSSLRSAGL